VSNAEKPFELLQENTTCSALDFDNTLFQGKKNQTNAIYNCYERCNEFPGCTHFSMGEFCIGCTVQQFEPRGGFNTYLKNPAENLFKNIQANDFYLVLLADINGDGKEDIVGFSNYGAHTSLSNGDGTFSTPILGINDFGDTQTAGSWEKDKHPIFLADINGDGKSDIVGFHQKAVYASLSNGDGTFTEKEMISLCCTSAGGWKISRHPRFMADINGDGKADLVGFSSRYTKTNIVRWGDVWDPTDSLEWYSFKQDWRVDDHPRIIADINGDGMADIVGFFNDGVYPALSNGDGTFGKRIDESNFLRPERSLNKYGHDSSAGRWRVDEHPRFVSDIDGDGRADIVGFHDNNVKTSLSLGNGTFKEPMVAVEGYAFNLGWRVDTHPRFMADINGDGQEDIVGFYKDGVYSSLSNGDGTFANPRLVLDSFGSVSTAGGWRKKHYRFMADINGDGKADIVGVNDYEIITSLSNGDGTFSDLILVTPMPTYSQMPSVLPSRKPSSMPSVSLAPTTATSRRPSSMPSISQEPTMGPVNVTIELELDQYPSETGWKIEDLDGNTLSSVSSGSYATSYSTIYKEVLVASGLNYTFSLLDSFGDGQNGHVIIYLGDKADFNKILGFYDYSQGNSFTRVYEILFLASEEGIVENAFPTNSPTTLPSMFPSDQPTISKAPSSMPSAKPCPLGPEDGCAVCGEEKCVRNSLRLYFGFTCGEYESKGLSGSFSLDECTEIQSSQIFSSSCECR